MKKIFRNVILALIFALCCVFVNFKYNFISYDVNATENEKQEICTLKYKDEVYTKVLYLYDDETYYCLYFRNDDKRILKEYGTYSYSGELIILISNEGVEQTIKDNGDGYFSVVLNGIAPDNNCNHVEQIINEKEPTCLEDGNTFGVQCKLCGGILHYPVLIPKVDHNYGEWILKREATPTRKGLKERTCIICNTKETNEFEYVESDYKVIGTYSMTMKTKELATLKLFNNNIAEITVNKLDSSIFKIQLNYQKVDEQTIVLFNDDYSQEYIIILNNDNNTFTPELTENQKNIDYWENLIMTLLVSFLGSGGTLGVAKVIISKWHKKKQEELDKKVETIETEKNNSVEQKELINSKFNELEKQFKDVLEQNTILSEYIKSKIQIDEEKTNQINQLLKALLPNIEENGDANEE